LSALNPSNTKSFEAPVAPQRECVCIAAVDSANSARHINDWWPALPSVAATLLAVIFVHQLTKRRDREKYLYELHSKVVTMADEATSAAARGWSAKTGAERATAIAETKWRLQLLGAALARLRVISGGWRFRRSWTGPAIVNVEITMEKQMSDFRHSLTIDPFEDPKRRSMPKEAVACEAAKGTFLLALDLKLRFWILPD
jgi:hypothetical protein